MQELLQQHRRKRDANKRSIGTCPLSLALETRKLDLSSFDSRDWHN